MFLIDLKPATPRFHRGMWSKSRIEISVLSSIHGKILNAKVCPRINGPPNTFFSPKIRVFGVWRWFWAFWIAMGIGYHVLLTEIKKLHFFNFFCELIFDRKGQTIEQFSHYSDFTFLGPIPLICYLRYTIILRTNAQV